MALGRTTRNRVFVDFNTQPRAAGNGDKSIGIGEHRRIGDIVQQVVGLVVMDAQALFLDHRIGANRVQLQAGTLRYRPYVVKDLSATAALEGGRLQVAPLRGYVREPERGDWGPWISPSPAADGSGKGTKRAARDPQARPTTLGPWTTPPRPGCPRAGPTRPGWTSPAGTTCARSAPTTWAARGPRCAGRCGKRHSPAAAHRPAARRRTTWPAPDPWWG